VVDAKHRLIVAHEVINTGHDRDQLSNMATQAREAMGTKRIKVVADRGYYSGPEILAWMTVLDGVWKLGWVLRDCRIASLNRTRLVRIVAGGSTSVANGDPLLLTRTS
jgi:hypothetical protein